MRFLTIGLLMFFATINLSAQWEEINHPAGDIGVLYSYNNKIFAGSSSTRSGLFVSENNGESWISLGLKKNYIIYSILVSQQNIFVGTDKGLFKSTNDGEEWIDLTKDLIYKTILDIAVKDSYIFISVDYRGLFVSNDGGNSWVHSLEVEKYQSITSIAFKDEYVFVAHSDKGVFRTSDYGISWEQSNNGLLFLETRALLVQENNLYVSVKSSVFLSTDNGNNWNKLILVSDVIPSIGLAVQKELIFLGVYDLGIFTSTNNGLSWSKENDGLPDKFTLWGSKSLVISNSFIFVVAIDWNTGKKKLYRRPLSDFTTSVTDNIKSVFVSPNPASDYITVDGIELGDKVEIHCVLGIKQIEQIYNGSIDISQLSPGMYFLKLYTMSGEVLVEKVLVGF